MLSFNRRFVFFLALDAVILLGLMGVFAAVNHAFVPEASQQKLDPLVYGNSLTPIVDAIPQTLATVAVIPQSIIARRPEGEIQIATDADILNLQKLLSKTVQVTVHTVQMGENYWTIAKKNNIDKETLIGANPTMPFEAKVKESLNILSRKGVLHTVKKGEDLARIASDYGVDEKTLKTENGLSWWKRIHEGDVVFIPDAKPLLMVKEWRDYFSTWGVMFGNPLGHWRRINSPFGPRTDPLTGDIRHHGGVDLHAKYGDPVYAAAKGKVVFTGVSGGYGNLIVVAHGNGYQTFYGHLSKIYAKTGQRVRRGALIGRVGATGRVTGPHLHFEIRKKGKAVNPEKYI